MNTDLTITKLKGFIQFAKKQGIPRFKLGNFECEIPPKDPTKKQLDELNYKIAALEATCQRLSLQIDNRLSPGIPATPFTNRINLAKGKKP